MSKTELSAERLAHIESMGPHMNSIDRLDLFTHIAIVTNDRDHWKREAEQAHDVIEEFSEGLRTLEAERNKAQGRAMVHAITIGQLRDVLELVRPTIAKEHRELADKVLAQNGGGQ